MINWDLYESLGVELQPGSITNEYDEKIAAVKKLVSPFTRFKVGSPTSKLQFDNDWDEYCQGTPIGNEASQGFNEAGFVFPERSGFAPAEISLGALIPQLGSYGESELLEANVIEDEITEWMDELDDKWIGSFRTLSFEEAIDGISDHNGTLEKMDLSKSPGFGFSLLHHDKKGWLFYSLEELKGAVEWALHRNVTMGEVVLHFLKGSEKDEKRDMQRVIDHKTRLFMAASIVDVIISRMLFGDYVRKFIHAGKNLGFYSAAGMEVYGGKWDAFVRHMTWNLLHAKIWPGDIAKYDKKFPQSWHYADGRSLSRICTDVWARPAIVRQFRANSMAPCVLTICGWVFIRPKDNPSGSLMTTVSNTRGVMRKLLRTWRVKLGPNASLTEFFKHVRNKIIGDDLALNLTPDCPITYDDVIAEFGKNGWEMAIPDGCTCHLDDSFFAGRRSILAQCGGVEIFLPVIDQDRILAINEFRKGKKDDIKRLMRAYAAVELSFPLLFEDGNHLFAVLYDYFLSLIRTALREEHWPELVSTARGLPTMDRIWKMYTGLEYSPSDELSQLLQRQRDLAGERSKEYRQTMDVGLRPHSW